jgi:hypothetical protein
MSFTLTGDYTLSYFAVSSGNVGTQIALYPLTAVGTGDFNQPSADADETLQSGDGTPVLWIMNGTTATEVTEANPGTSWVLSATGDFNSDGNADLAFQNVNGTPAIWLMNGTTEANAADVTNPQGQVQNPTSSNHIAGSGDVFDTGFNNDLLWQNNDGQPSIWQMNGTTAVNQDPLANPDQNANGTPNGAAWVLQGSGDFFDTGFNNDLLFQEAGGQPSIWQMNGATEVNASDIVNKQGQAQNPGPSWRVIGAGDFTGDGHNDSILFQNNNGQPAIWVMNGFTAVDQVALSNPGASWVITGIGNFNGASNGQSDIFWENTGSGQAAVWILTATTNGGTLTITETSTIVTPPTTYQLSANSAYTTYTTSQTGGAPAAATGTDLSSSLVASTQAPVLGINNHA